MARIFGCFLVFCWLVLASSVPQPAGATGFVLNDASLLSASYFGQSGNQAIRAIRIASNGQIVLAGSSSSLLSLNASLGSTVYGATGSGEAGFVAILSPDGQQLRYSAVFAAGVARIEDLALDEQDRIYLSGTGYTGLANLIAGSGTYDTSPPGSSGRAFVARLSQDAQQLEWASFHPGGTQLSLLSGARAVAGGATTVVFSADGKQLLLQLKSEHSSVADVLADAAAQRIYLTGYHQVAGNLQTPFLEAFDANSGARIWQAYRRPASELQALGLGADSRGVALALDPAGQLLAAFTSDGGNTVLSRDPFDPSIRIENSVLSGAYQRSYGSGGGPKSSFVAVFNPQNGQILDASFLHGTLSNGKTNTTTVRALAADAQGRVYAVGDTACCFPAANSAAPLSSTRFVNTYNGGDAFLAVFTADLSRLEFGSSMGGGRYLALDVRHAQIAAAGESSSESVFVRNALQVARAPGNNSDGKPSSDGIFAVLDNGLAPPATAGADQRVSFGRLVQLRGGPPAQSSYQWRQVSGPQVTLSDAETATASFFAPASAATLTFELTVQSVSGKTSTDTLSISVLPVVANAQVPTVVTPGSRVELDASASESSQPISSYLWEQISGAAVQIEGSQQAVAAFTAPSSSGELQLRLTISNSLGSDSLLITILLRYQNHLPRAVR